MESLQPCIYSSMQFLLIVICFDLFYFSLLRMNLLCWRHLINAAGFKNIYVLAMFSSAIVILCLLGYIYREGFDDNLIGYNCFVFFQTAILSGQQRGNSHLCLG